MRLYSVHHSQAEIPEAMLNPKYLYTCDFSLHYQLVFGLFLDFRKFTLLHSKGKTNSNVLVTCNMPYEPMIEYNFNFFIFGNVIKPLVLKHPIIIIVGSYKRQILDEQTNVD